MWKINNFGVAKRSNKINYYKTNPGGLVFDIFNHLLMILIIIVMLYPFLHVIALSLSEPKYIYAGVIGIFPKGLNLVGYETIFKGTTIWRAYANTIMYVVLYVIINLTVTSMFAYAITMKEFVFRKFLNIMLLITMFFGGGMIPSYLLIRDLRLMGTIWAIILPGAIGAYNAFVYRSFFNGIPASLRESAFIDGANDLIILFRIYLPLSKPLLATFGLFAAVGMWNSWYSALLYLKSKDMYPIQMILREILFISGASGGTFDEATQALSAQRAHPYNVQMATVVATMGPILLVYPFIQKYFVKGVMIGSVKG